MRLSGLLAEEHTKISIASRIEEIDAAVTQAVDFAKQKGFSDDAIFGIDMAVREAVANAVKHGNCLDDRKSVDITLSDDSKSLKITIRDYGNGFSVEDVPDPRNPENLLKTDGRGILFMQNFVDVVEWHNHPDGGMYVKMVKNR
ncbi:MAG: ATP-binding protein [Acidobacteriota bacterium]|nr:ATP-binding protein [Acidobacteriota bacterium]